MRPETRTVQHHGSDSHASSGLVNRLLHEPAPLKAIAARPYHPWLVVASVCIGAFMGQLDASIVSLVLPTLEESFHAHVSSVQWVAIIYLLVLTGLLMPLGRVADKYGRKALYTLGFLIFVGGSALCGFATSLWFLIAARAAQGVGAALLQANSVAIIVAAVPRRQLGRAIGVQGTAQALGLAVGPTVGGFLIAWFDWRWVFLVNLPIGIVGSALAIMILPRTSHQAAGQSFNRLGALLIPLAIGAFLLGLTFFNLTIIMLVLTVVLLFLFARSERTAPEPLLGTEVLHAPGLMTGMIAGLLSYVVLFGTLFAVPILLERVFDAGPDRAGLILTVVPAVLGSVALFGGWLSDHLGPRLPTIGGMALAMLGSSVIWWASDHRLPLLIVGLMLLGLGCGLFIPANNASVMGAAPRTHLGVAGGLLNVMRGLGTSVGVALVGLVLAISAGMTPTHADNVDEILAAFRVTMLCLAVAAVVAGLLSAQRRVTHRVPRPDPSEPIEI